MRVIVWGINYAPELTGIAPFNTGLCDYLRERGHQVEMVTTFPYYPFWKKLPGDEGRLYRTDDVDGIWVHRCWHYVPARSSTLKRMWHELSFGVTSFLRLVFLARPDVYVVVSPPLMLGPLAALMGWFKRRPYVFHVQDLQPDAAVGLGMVKPGRFTRLLYKVEAFAYRHAALVSGISDGMMAAFTRKGVPERKRVLFPNWLRWYGRNADAEALHEDRSRQAAAFRAKHHIPEGVFLASYSGNLGRKQGLDTLVAAAELLAQRAAPANADTLTTETLKLVTAGGGAPQSDSISASQRFSVGRLSHSLGTAFPQNGAPAVLLLIIGDGVMRRELEEQIAARGLTNVRMMPLLTEVDYHGMIAAAHVSLITQSPGTGQYFLPSKLLSVLSMQSPVVSAADDDSELAKAVAAGGFGINVPPADPQALAETLAQLAADPQRLEELRANTAWVRRFSATKVLGDYERRLIAVARSAHPI